MFAFSKGDVYKYAITCMNGSMEMESELPASASIDAQATKNETIISAGASAYVEAPAEFDPQPFMEGAFVEIKNYTAIFILEDGRVGSGIFVNSCGFDGILTANHVASPIMKGKRFSLCIAEHPHSLWLNPEHFEHVPIGKMRDRSDEQHLGPDLSFIIIRDSNLLEILRSLKSFCFLDSQKLAFFAAPPERLLWAVAGSPFESKTLVNRDCDPDGPLTKLSNFVGWGQFKARSVRDAFDYIDLEIPAGEGGYPLNYQGVSGGGIWLIPLEIDSNEDAQTVGYAKPILGGVAFFQTDPPIGGQRTIVGHGWESIYSTVKETLKSKRNTESTS